MVNEFKHGRTSIKDEHRSRRPVEVTNATVGVSQGTVFSILHEKLDVKKISARWVPHLLRGE